MQFSEGWQALKIGDGGTQILESRCYLKNSFPRKISAWIFSLFYYLTKNFRNCPGFSENMPENIIILLKSTYISARVNKIPQSNIILRIVKNLFEKEIYYWHCYSGSLRCCATFMFQTFELLFYKINTFLQKTTSCIQSQAEQIVSINI